MITVTEATRLISEHLWKPSIEEVDLISANGRVLARVAVADRDLPPFNRVAMDGIAVRMSDLQKGVKKFKKNGLILAGSPAQITALDHHAIEVMTGAVLPAGADVVIRYEDVRETDEFFELMSDDFRLHQNIHLQGSDARQHDTLLNEGILLTSAEIPLLASIGQSRVQVKTLPKVALVSTGDELVSINSNPLPYQIRSSNIYALSSGLCSLGVAPEMFHLGDQDQAIQKKMEQILDQFEVIILTGGVSKGKLDWVPQTLISAGIIKHFHQVAQRPGKPLWFGSRKNKIVFALPGNPVSVFLCFYKYIKPWLMASLGVQRALSFAVLQKDFISDIPLTFFLQVNIHNELGTLKAIPSPGGGSGDFANLRLIDGFLEIPPNSGLCSMGQAYPFIPIR